MPALSFVWEMLICALRTSLMGLLRWLWNSVSSLCADYFDVKLNEAQFARN